MRKLLFIATILAVVGCKKTDEDHPDLGYDYYPAEIGNYTIYDVKETIYAELADTVAITEYQLKESMDTTMVDLQGRVVYLLKRYTRENDTLDWKDMGDSFTVYRGSSRLERKEGNKTYVRLAFPLSRSKSWDGNALNDSSEQIYKVLDYDLKNIIGGKNFSRTCRVNQFRNQNLIEDQLEEEIYARTVGLVYRIERDYKLNTDSGTVESGREVTWTYLENGKE